MKDARDTGDGAELVAAAALATAVASVLAEAASGLGHRAGLWQFMTGFAILRYSAYLAVLSGVLSVAGLIRGFKRSRSAMAISAGALALSVLATAIPARLLATARSLPMIHDISTDTEDPPAFSAVAPLRRGAPNALEYGGPGLAVLQKKAYPQIRPLYLDMDFKSAFKRAVDSAVRLHWDVVRADEAEGIVEATDTTFWYGFKDDIVVRITTTDDGRRSRVDVRSVSRVGRSDVGTNAKRIERFLSLVSGPAGR